MPHVTADKAVHLEISGETTAEAFLPIKNDERKTRLEKKRRDDTMNVREQERELETRDIMTLENERMKLQFEENSKVREHELKMKREEKEIKKLKVEEDKIKLEREKLQFEKNREERGHKERMESFEVEKLNSTVKLETLRLAEKIMMEEKAPHKMNGESNRCEQPERRRQEDEADASSLRNLTLISAGVAATAGAISDALGATAAVGCTAGILGASAVLLQLSAPLAILGGAGYVYKKSGCQTARDNGELIKVLVPSVLKTMEGKDFQRKNKQ